MISREEVGAIYGAILGREPESEAAIALAQEAASLTALGQRLLEGEEFRARMAVDVFARSKWVCTEIRDGLRLWLDLADHGVSLGCLRGSWEPAETDFILAVLEPGDGFIDVGADIGWFSVLAAQAVGPRGRVHAFEPRADLAGRLRQSIADNGFEDRCRVEMIALGAEEGAIDLAWVPDERNPGHSFIVPRSMPEGAVSLGRVPVRPLDALGLDGPVRLIKIDVEGAEPLVLRGAQGLIARDRPILLIELFPYWLGRVSGTTADALLTQLRGWGYRIFHLGQSGIGRELHAGDDGTEPGGPEYFNVVALTEADCRRYLSLRLDQRVSGLEDRLRREIEACGAARAEVAALRADGAAALAQLRAQAEAEAAALRADGAAALAQLRAQAEAEAAALRADSAAALAQLRAQAEAEAAMLRADSAAAVAQLRARAEAEAAALRADRAAAIAQAEASAAAERDARSELQLGRDRLQAIEASTLWRAANPVRRLGGRLPAGLRRALGRGAKLLWWSASLQLPHRLRQYRDAIAAHDAGYAHIDTPAITHLAPSPGTKRRIAIISHDARFHGAPLLVLHIAEEVVRQDECEVEIILGDSGELQPAMAAIAQTRYVPFSDRQAWEAIARDLAASGVSTVICNTTVSGQVIPVLAAAGLRSICLVHEMPGILREYGLEATAKTVAADADVVVFPNEAVRSAFIGAFGAIGHRWLIRPQGLYRPSLPPDRREAARARIRGALGVGPDTILVLGLGYGDRRKGLDLWPAIASALRADGPAARFAWVGAIEPGLEAELRAAMDAQHLRDVILLPGRTETPQDFLAAADIFLLSSREDPFPSSALEAAAHGLPVVCFDRSGGMPKLVRETGLLPAPLEDTEAMGRAIGLLIRDPVLRAQAGKAGERIVEDRLRFPAYVRDLTALAAPPHEVTAIVPNYNYARYLPERLRSIWAQGHRVSEIIVLDDASSDDSLSVLEDLRVSSPIPIRIVPNAQNSGSVSRQWARGVELARHPLIWIAEADDLSEPDFLEALIPEFANPAVVMAYAQSKLIDEQGGVIAPDYVAYTSDVDARLWLSDYRRPGREEIRHCLSIKNTILNVSAVVMRRDAALPVLSETIEAMVSLRNAADWLFYVRMLERGDIAFKAAALNHHRRHASGLTISSGNVRHLEEIAQVQALAARISHPDAERRQAARAFLEYAAGVFALDQAEAARCIELARTLENGHAPLFQRPFRSGTGADLPVQTATAGSAACEAGRSGSQNDQP
ncbi:FkbM family methyltransferase [Roseomonas sp. OT10]|uniref:FkbM family methyltransferase n=1 Tax=Roseomonas cutis TaxID=2897332 RepID=UPI001E5EBC45|nr:FkbM family methyltransferase [Roseomonas sp. OT10]UFN50973.1 FkbM family methyltransferase [Roseomonas sp. OT10]